MKKDRKSIRTLILVLGGISAIGPFSIDMYLPGFACIAGEFNTGIGAVGYTLTAYLAGICFGQLVYGPLTDRYGRKMPLLTGLAIYIISSAGCAMAGGIRSLILMRLFQALGGCVGMVACRAIVRDRFPVSLVAKVFSSLMLVMGAAPIIAPILGGEIIPAFGWRSVFWILAAFGVFLFILASRLLQESKTPDPSVSLHPARVVKNYFEVLKNREFLIYGLASSCLSAGLMAYISGSPGVFIKLFGLTERQFSWLYAANAFGLIGGSQLNHILLKRSTSGRISLITASAQLAAALLLTAAAFGADRTRAPFYVLVFLCLAMCGILNPNTTALALKSMERSAGSASAMLGFMQTTAGGLASFAVGALHNGTALPMAAVMAALSLAGVSLLLIAQFRVIPAKSAFPA
jgi:DHA1 family bicyclomycin/chloramphenicol resistance-like MFS transporter